ncbi:sulfite reductase (NADPH) flavoprotein alpha-component [Alkalicoccus daliensis]|uniref:assimilatory sulfite reductase (NADPH) n=1 Tax=Alkalicoccus daliensis TaxID=745820 RepID=A0A1H0KQ34_9BACI|nr:sulfite reductase (NADPH) flavoprotein alpha-component [Alkalicoccus daliensis]
MQTSNSPFNEKQTELLNQLLPTMTEGQKQWLSGFVAASAASTAPAVLSESAETPEASASPAETRAITILVGSQTGNGQALGEEFAEKLAPAFKVKLSNMDSYKPKQIKEEEDLLIITSTHGDGEPPDNAIPFYDFLQSKRAPKLTGVRFSVLSLGDSSYEFFCQTGKDFDKRLEELGAERFYPRVDCDLDYEDDAESWFEGVRSNLEASLTAPAETPRETAPSADKATPKHSKKNPFHAEILENINLNGRGSNKETRHLELDLEGSNLTYEPGDSLGIIPQNDPVLVENLLQEMNWDPEEPVETGKEGTALPVREALTSTYDITTLTKPLLDKLAPFSEKLQELIKDETERKAYLEGRDLLDLLKDFAPWSAGAGEIIGQLRPIPPRLYSIASSLKANEDEVHLTVGALRYDAHGRARSGVCSVQCAERSEAGDTLPVFVQSNQNFKLPEDSKTPIIMIGAGTGIAPYRSFMEEREESEQAGNSWLFFGDQHFVTDFLYQTEWQAWMEKGILTNMEVAFSRDQEEKVYVQHRLLEQGEELFQWLEDGAHVYVCGDEKRMAKDVHQALVRVVSEQKNVSEEEADAYLSEMRQAKRYQRDVY